MVGQGLVLSCVKLEAPVNKFCLHNTFHIHIFNLVTLKLFHVGRMKMNVETSVGPQTLRVLGLKVEVSSQSLRLLKGSSPTFGYKNLENEANLRSYASVWK